MTLDQRKFRLSLMSGSGLLLLGGLLACLNLLAGRFSARWDWTAGNRYSLSAATRQLVESLPDPVVVRYYLTPDLPQPYETQARYVRDILNEFRAAARGRWAIETVVPDASDAMAFELHRVGIRSTRFSQRTADQYQVREGYMGVVLYYQDKQDVLPFINNPDALEYEIASRLRVMSRPDKKTLFFISNHDEVSPHHLKQGPAARLFAEFRVEPTRLTKEDPGLTPDAVYLLGPKNKLTDDELDVLDDYLAKGIPLVVALNRRVVFPNNLRSMAQSTGLEEYLEHYGVKVERDFIMDKQCPNVRMSIGDDVAIVRYWPFILADRLNKSHPALESLDVLGFPYGSPLVPSFAGPSPLTFTELARSSEQSWIWSSLYNVDPASLSKQAKQEQPSQVGPFTLAALVEGTTVTFRSPPRPVPHLRLVVMGTSFFADPQVPNPEGNALFILTLAQWLTRDGDPLSIPPKSSPYRPLKSVPDWLRSLIKGFAYFFVPGAVILAGLWRMQRREIIRESVRAAFADRAEKPHA